MYLTLFQDKPLALTKQPGGILADEMGLGKTVEVLGKCPIKKIGFIMTGVMYYFFLIMIRNWFIISNTNGQRSIQDIKRKDVTKGPVCYPSGMGLVH